MKLPTEAIANNKNTSSDALVNTADNFNVAKVPDNYVMTGYGAYESMEYIEHDQKAKVKFIKYVEGTARKSLELKLYLDFLRENTDMQACKILNGVDSESARIELHHYPFTLFDIARIIVDKAIANKSDVSSFKIIEEIVEVHYKGLVGLVPLSETVHELVHAGKLTVSLASVTGNWQEFVRQYAEYLQPEDIDKLKFLIHASSTQSLENENRRKLKVIKRVISYEPPKEKVENDGQTTDPEL